MHELFWFLLCLLIAGIQYFFSTRNNVYWGALLPFAFLVFIIWIGFSTGKITITYILVFLGGLAVFLGIWNEGRESLKKKRKKELEKMKTYDIK